MLQWPKVLWSHLWINYLYFFARKWRIVCKFSCFAMEGSHRRLKRMPESSNRGHRLLPRWPRMALPPELLLVLPQIPLYNGTSFLFEVTSSSRSFDCASIRAHFFFK